MIMAQNTIKRLAASMLKAGESRIRFQPGQMSRINEALTRDDVRQLIKEGIIYAIAKKGVSRARARKRAEARRAGRQAGYGRRKGTKKARIKPKLAWIAKVRSQRKLLLSLKEAKAITKQTARKIYMMIKGNVFRGKSSLISYLKENKLLDEAAFLAMQSKQAHPNAKKMGSKKIGN